MSIGIIILVTLTINQGIKRLPTRGKSRLELFLYSSMIGVGSHFLHLRGLVQHLLIQIGISEDLNIPASWSGVWTVKKFLVTKDGSIDITATIFVSWSIRVFPVVLILQSSVDPLLAGGALITGILISSILKIIRRKLLLQRNYVQDDETKNCSRGLIHATTFASPLPRGFIPFPRHSTKHTRREKKVNKGELEKFTRESTEKAMKELVSSPSFGEWAVKNAARISVNPIKESSSKSNDTDKRRRWFHWY
ncbi:unnamed protein product [Arabis nemorensis]|uniref:Uncharacterized protein n=1 Tax=Arabis nemorensis TaxID=586526 RepID=A0A565AXP0_9BRAS|nr:unnamed protein product [Arabis nemorensis]